MDPNTNENDNQSEQKRPQGGLSQGINQVNNLIGGGIKLPKLGTKAATQAATKGLAAFLAGPGLPIAIAILAVFLLTFIIVGFGGVPGAPPQQNGQTNTTQ